jgi:TetR/AcrR family transcriptional regulator, transcriptional repressor for nem operon
MSKAEQKQKSHDAIVASAASLLRKQGIRASSVMDVMKGAGLTVGGFYGHFDSKEHLFAETIQSTANTMWKKLLETAKGASPHERILSVMGRYLSRTHRDNAEGGCLLPNAAPEIAREGEPYRTALEKELGGFIQSFGQMLGDGAERRQKAIGLIALMFGALTLSRAVAGTALSDEFLRAAKTMGERALSDAPKH